MLVDNILEIFFPRFCLVCGYVGRYICPSCEKKLQKNKQNPSCVYCKKRSFLGLTHPSCRRKNGIDGYVSPYSYGTLFKKIIHTVKYKGAYKVLQEVMLFPLYQTGNIVLKWNSLAPLAIQAVPLHKERLNERGFNQVDYIIKPLCSLLHTNPLYLLKKTKKTKSQATLRTDEERYTNVKGSFTCLTSAQTKCVLLVDDVVTTGSTIRECSRLMKQNGVTNVFVFSLACGRNRVI